MIRVNYRGRLGNNLFQYSLGRILAQELGFALHAQPIPHFPPTSDVVGFAEHESPLELLTGHQIDLGAVIRDRRSRCILLDGYFQDARYYLSYEDEIKAWFPLPEHPNTCHELVIHIRRTDYVENGWALPFSFYQQAIAEALPYGGKIHIATDDESDPFLRRFAKWNPELIREDEITTLTIMARAQALIISQCSFSWWAAFLAPRPQLVICPVPHFGVWSQRGELSQVNLIMRDRFTCIDCTEPYRASLFEAAYQMKVKSIRSAVRFIRQMAIAPRSGTSSR